VSAEIIQAGIAVFVILLCGLILLAIMGIKSAIKFQAKRIDGLRDHIQKLNDWLDGNKVGNKDSNRKVRK